MTFPLFWRAGIAAGVALLPLAACSGEGGPAAPAVTVTVTAPPATPSQDSATSLAPGATTSPTASPSAPAVADPAVDDDWPVISNSTPPVFGDTFQSDPGHDFSHGLSPSRDGVLRGRMRAMRDENVVEYVPVRWVRDDTGQTSGHFASPPEQYRMVFAAPIAKNVTFLSAVGCKGSDQTINSAYLGTERCSRDTLIARADEGKLYALITVRGGQIVRVAEIYAP